MILALLTMMFAGGGTLGSEVESPISAARAGEPEDERTPVAVPEPSALALRYYRTGNWLWAFNQTWALAIPAVFLFTGASARLRDLSNRWGRFRPLSIGIYVVLYLAIVFLVDLPLHYYQGFVRQHAYGLSNQTFPKWLGDSFKREGVSALVGFLFTWVPYLLMARRPRTWWFDMTLLSIPFLCFIVLFKPVWVDPLFNDFGPMKDKALEARILGLAERAGISGSRIFEVDKSRDTKAMNAYVTGLLGTKRIVLWDTLLAKLDDKEVLAVVGHEMGHYVLGHIPRSILLSSAITLASLLWVDRAGRWLIGRFSGRFGFDRLSDVASVPLLLFLLHLASLALAPAANAYSRAQEREADRFALEITRANRSAAQAFAVLQRENLGNPRPGLFYKIWRSTHPSIAERIEFCNAYHPWDEARPDGDQARTSD